MLAGNDSVCCRRQPCLLLVHEQMAKFRTIGTSLLDLKPHILLHAWVPRVSETTIGTAGQSSFYSELNKSYRVGSSGSWIHTLWGVIFQKIPIWVSPTEWYQKVYLLMDYIIWKLSRTQNFPKMNSVPGIHSQNTPWLKIWYTVLVTMMNRRQGEIFTPLLDKMNRLTRLRI